MRDTSTLLVDSDSNVRCDRRDFLPIALTLAGSALLWTILFAVLPPARQNFPLDDDAVYARGVFAFLRGEGIHYFGWPSMPQLGQWLWALPFVRIFGESHVALRCSTILLSWAGLVAFSDLLRQSGIARVPAAFAIASLAFSPLFFLLSGTFMTDVPSLSLSLIALTCYSRALRGGQLYFMVAGTVVACLAALTRQNTLAVPVAVGLLRWRSPSLRANPMWVPAILLPIAVGVGTHTWLMGRPDVARLKAQFALFRFLLLCLLPTILLLGLSVSPLLVHEFATRPLRLFLAALILMVAGAGLFGVNGVIFPYVGNTLGFPLRIIPAGIVGERANLFHLRAALTALGCVAGAMLLVSLTNCLRNRPHADPIIVFTTVHLAFLLVSPTFWDRYLLVLLPGAIAITASSGCDWSNRWKPHAAALIASGLLSFILMHDWLAWNSARWELGRRALARGIPVADIQGGLEWNLWHCPGWARQGRPLPARGLADQWERMWFPYLTGRFALAFSSPPGTVIVDSEPYHLWLIHGRQQFLLIKEQH